MNSPAVLHRPEQMVMEWMPQSLAERTCRAEGQWTGQKRVARLEKYQPVFEYLVLYPRKRHINKSAFILAK